ncbi:MAG: hypothetical protein QOI24_3159 [Acidobacteriota bacterium]|nr:hypothetical protein [Acidobacteriota bacterium]
MRQPKLWAFVLLILTAAAGSALAAPGAFTLAGSGQCNGTSPVIALSWTASAGATSYTVYRNGSPIITLPSSTTAYNDGAPVSGSFTYFVRATDGSATSDSNSVQLSVPNCLPAPGAFTLSGNEYCDTSTPQRRPGVHLSWTASSNATTYDVYQNNGRILQGMPANQRSLDIISSDFFVGAQPQFYVVAVNNTGTTSSNTLVVPITSNACPPLPTSPTLSGNAACDTSTNPAHAIVNLTWTTSANATAYQIFRNNSAYGAATGTTYTDNNASPGQSYTYFIRATNSGGSADSNTIGVDVSANICGTPPGAFTLTGSAACNAGAGGVHLSWGASSGATGYNVFRNNSMIAGPIASTSYDDTSGLTVGNSYTYRVAAINTSGTTQSNSVDVNVSGANCGPPGAFVVSAVTPFCTGAPAPALRVNWSQASNASSYVVNRNGSPISGSLPSSTTSYDDTTVSPGQTYNYTVTAGNGGGTTLSTGANGTAATSCAQQPPLPGGFSASATPFCTNGSPSAPGVHVTWSASSNASTYVVNRNGLPISSALPATTTSYDDTNVSGRQNYSYSVTATNSSGNTTSTSAFVTPSSNCAPPVPSAPTLSSSTVCAGSPSAPVVKLSWTVAGGASNYTVYRNGSAYSGLLPSTTLSFDDASVAAGQSYTYAIRASNVSGSTDSNLLTVSIPAGTCQSPPSDFSLIANAFCDRSGNAPAPGVRLNWIASSGVTTYNIVRNGSQIASVSSSTLTYSDPTNVNAGTTYTYFVRAVGDGGTTNSNSVSVTPSSSVCASAGAPDLVPSNAIVAPARVLPGDRISITVTVTNGGDASASATTTRIRFGTSTVAALSTPALNAGASTTLTTTITVPSLPEGTYFLFITVDDDRILAQSNTANDTLQSDPIRVRATSCSTECGVTVVQAASAGSVVAFALTNAPICVGANVTWNFGDGAVAVSTSDVTSHVYVANGTYNWTVTISANGASCQSSGTIVITSGSHPPRRRVAGH